MKPMLAAQCEDPSALRFPLYATPKIDGIRCLILDGEATARSLKPIPNEFIRAKLQGLGPFDGELLVGESFQSVTSGVMSEDGEPDFRYYVFDYVSDEPYLSRIAKLEAASASVPAEIAARLVFLLPVKINTHAELDEYTAKCLADGHEGVMVRSGSGPYKQGRSTFKEGFLVKIKPFEDAEATVIGFDEQMHNGNEAVTNELGRAKRSSHKANLTPKGTLGALVVEHPEFGQFKIGTGFDDALRLDVWQNRSAFLGKLVTFSFQRIGMKDKPRIPVFKSFRSSVDMDSVAGEELL